MLEQTGRSPTPTPVAEIPCYIPESDLIHALLVPKDLARLIMLDHFTPSIITDTDPSWLKARIFGRTTYIGGITEVAGHELPTSMVCTRPNILKRVLAYGLGREPFARVDIEIVAVHTDQEER